MRTRPAPRVTDARVLSAAAAAAVLVEPMERRQLLSAVLSHGVLTVTGTVAVDPVSVTLQAAHPDATPATAATIQTITDGNSQTFAAAGVTAISVVLPNGGGTAYVEDSIVANPNEDPTEDDFSAFLNDAVSVTGGSGNDDIEVLFTNQDAPGVGPTAVASVYVDAGAGNDIINYQGESPATLHGGDGNDVLTDDADATVYVYGDAGNDVLHDGGFVTGAAIPTAYLYGGAGDDSFTLGDEDYQTFISGGDGTDTLDLSYTVDDAQSIITDPVLDLRGTTGTGNLTLAGDLENVYDPKGNYEDEVIGNASANVIDATGADSVLGMGGNDRLTAGYESYINGGDGNDTLVIGTDSLGSTLVGGAGTDAVDYSSQTAGQTVYLGGSQPSTGGIVFDGTVEQAYGGSGNDLIYGTKGDNALFGNGGNDTLVADGGTDALFGGPGNDTVYADDGGASYVNGGGGTDTAYVDPAGDTTVGVATVVRRRGGVALAGPTKLAGTAFGTAGSYQKDGNTIAKALDGNVGTFFDAPSANGDVVGLDLGSAKAVTQIALAPRAGLESRMVGGTIQASNSATFASGVVSVYTVTSAPTAGVLTTFGINDGSYRYWRYVAPAGSYGNVAEFVLFA